MNETIYDGICQYCDSSRILEHRTSENNTTVTLLCRCGIRFQTSYDRIAIAVVTESECPRATKIDREIRQRTWAQIRAHNGFTHAIRPEDV